MPLDVYVREAERVGYETLDAKSLLYGYLLGREWPAGDARVREIAETLLSDRRGPHLPRPGDADDLPREMSGSCALGHHENCPGRGNVRDCSCACHRGPDA